MKKRNTIIYWVATIWLALGMLSTGMVQLLKVDEEVANVTQLGYPLYLLTILGLWKLAGVIAVLVPKFPLLKEWAYAGFFFTMTGALFSRILAGDEVNKMFPSMLLLILTVISWHYRPSDRKIISSN